MVYCLLDINWVIGCLVKNKLWAWDEIGKKSKIVKIIPFNYLLGGVGREEQQNI